MADNKDIMGVFADVDTAAEGARQLKSAGFVQDDYDVLTGNPYPEGAFGEHVKPNRLFVFALAGGFVGFAIAFLFTAATQTAFPLVTGGKPILAIPAMMIIMYEMTLLFAMIFTVTGVIFESRLPRPSGAGPVYDTRITLGYIGLIVTTSEDRLEKAEEALKAAGAEDIVRESS
ncbi:MAG: DUF3341 domain-containing protein [Chloroflexota bacterium]|nr:DUF3341 domain-containing protein [Chloroflexota bacterium]